jgi:hypothetical protein
MPDTATLEPTLDQAKRFLALSHHIMTELTYAKILLEQKLIVEPDPGASVSLRAEAAQIEACSALVRARIRAFDAGHRAIRPPTPDDVTTARTLGTRLGGLMPAQARTTDVVDLAAQLFTIWQGTQA